MKSSKFFNIFGAVIEFLQLVFTFGKSVHDKKHSDNKSSNGIKL